MLCGNGRFDSPGFSAKYMTYFIQDTVSRKIIALEVGMKSQVNEICYLQCRSITNVSEKNNSIASNTDIMYPTSLFMRIQKGAYDTLMICFFS